MTRNARKMHKYLLTVACIALVAGLAIGGTIAWLVAQTDPVTNTFTVGNIDIELQEHDYVPETNTLNNDSLVNTNEDYLIIPGTTLPKDPFVTVYGGSEACYLFIKVEAADDSTLLTTINDKITWSVADGWMALAGQTGVYYRVVTSSEDNQTFAVLTGNQIVVSDDLTKADVDALNESYTMKITAYAVQEANVENAATAWGYVDTAYVDNSASDATSAVKSDFSNTTPTTASDDATT